MNTCREHPTEEATFYCMNPDCHQWLCTICKPTHPHDEKSDIIGLELLHSQTMQAIKTDMRNKFEAQLKSLPTRFLFHKTLGKLQPYFATGNFFKEDMIDHLSNFIQVDYFEQVTAKIKSSLIQSQKPLYAYKPKKTYQIDLQESTLISAQYYYSADPEIDDFGKEKKGEPDENDWPVDKLPDHAIMNTPMYPFVQNYEIEKLQNDKWIVFWSIVHDTIAVFTDGFESDEEIVEEEEEDDDYPLHKFYKVPKEMRLFTLVKVAGSLYIAMVTDDSLKISLLKKAGEKNTQLGNLDFQEIKQINCEILRSGENRIFTVTDTNEAELFEVQVSDSNSFNLRSLSSWKMPFKPKSEVVDFSRNLVLTLSENGDDLFVYRMTNGLQRKLPLISRLRNVKRFKWHEQNGLLLVNDRLLYRFNKNKFQLLRVYKGLQLPLLTKQGILFVQADKLFFTPYCPSKKPRELSLPRDEKLLKEADDFANGELEGTSDYAYSAYKPNFTGHKIDYLQFLNSREESLILMNLRNLQQKNFYVYGEDEDNQDNQLISEVDTYRIFKLSWEN